MVDFASSSVDSEASPARRPRDFVPRLQFSALGICRCPLAFSRGRCWIEYFQGFTQVKQINVRQRERVEDPLDDGFYRDGRGPVADGEAGRQLVKAMALVCTPRKPS